MKTLVFSDLHFFRGRNRYLLDTCNWIASEVSKLAPAQVVFCGDLNHAHNYVEVDTLHAMSLGITAICKATVQCGTTVLAISGNHDTTLKDGGENIIQSLGVMVPGLTAITSPQKIGNSVFVPHPPTNPDAKARFTEQFALAAVGATSMFSHVELADVRYTPASSHCTDHPFEIPSSIKLVVNGHYHHPQVTETAGRKQVIVGSPCYHSYADMLVATPRGFIVVDTETREVVFHENPIGPIYHTIETSQIPALGAHKDVGRMLLRVKVASKEDYDINRKSIEALRQVAASVRVLGSNPKASSEIYKAETSTIGISDPSEMIASYGRKHNMTKDEVSYAAKVLAEVSGR